jgi:hypothetical protein
MPGTDKRSAVTRSFHCLGSCLAVRSLFADNVVAFFKPLRQITSSQALGKWIDIRGGVGSVDLVSGVDGNRQH